MSSSYPVTRGTIPVGQSKNNENSQLQLVSGPVSVSAIVCVANYNVIVEMGFQVIMT